jgi:hypothetical protein
LDTAERLVDQPGLEEAVKAGVVSLAQAGEIAAVADGAAAERLVDAARAGVSMKALKDRCRRVAAETASAEADRARVERLRRARFFKTWVDSEGAGWGQFKMAPGDYARWMALFKPFQDQVFNAARQAGSQDSYAAYGADALLALAETAAGSGSGSSSGRVAATVVAVVDLAALRRGFVDGGETCEIVGVGPVPVAALDGLLSDSFFAAAVVDGTDIRRVVHLGRQPTALQRTALWVRDRTCVHCGSLHNLEIDHVDEWSGTLRTQLDKLAFLCRRCHRLKTHHGWRFTGQPGGYKLLAPATDPDPP